MAGRVRVLLEVERSEPITGSLQMEGGPAKAFVGWLGLMAALREAAPIGEEATSQQVPSSDAAEGEPDRPEKKPP